MDNLRADQLLSADDRQRLDNAAIQTKVCQTLLSRGVPQADMLREARNIYEEITGKRAPSRPAHEPASHWVHGDVAPYAPQGVTKGVTKPAEKLQGVTKKAPEGVTNSQGVTTKVAGDHAITVLPTVDIPGFPGYQIDPRGNVYRDDVPMKATKQGKGSGVVRIKNEAGAWKTVRTSALLALVGLA